MTMTILIDSMARDHAATIQANAALSRRAREARLARRDKRAASRAAERDGRPESHSHAAAASVAHIAARPFTAAHNWLAAGQL